MSDRGFIFEVTWGESFSRSSRFDAAALQKRLTARGVIVSAPQKDTFLIGVNETINRTTAAALTEAFTG